MSALESPSSFDRKSGPASRSSWLEADVVCGVNYSDFSAQAALAAAALAERLVIVHALDEGLRAGIPEESWEPVVHSARERLRHQQEVLRALRMATVESSFRTGNPAAVMLEEAKRHRAKLLVTGAACERAGHLWPSRTTAEEVAETAEIPTLIVHQAAPFFQWVRGERRLRVFVAMDSSPPSEAALRWVDWLRRAAPCEIIAASLETDSPPSANEETVPSLFMNEMALKAAHAEERLLESEVRMRFGLSNVSTRFEKTTGNVGTRLVQLAVRNRADLIVVGTHSRHGWRRIGHHSVSRFILRHAPVSVLVCPALQDKADSCSRDNLRADSRS